MPIISMVLRGIATKPVKKGPMVPAQTGVLLSTGLSGNYYGALRGIMSSRRQVTVISLEQWGEAMKELNADIPWFMRRANLCVAGHSFTSDDVGKVLTIGSSAMLEITGETDPCKRMEEILPGLQAALTPSWRGGVTCRVLMAGGFNVNDAVTLQQ